MQPVLLCPAFKEYLWGGEKLKTQYGKKSPFGKVAESWELSCHEQGPSRVASGAFEGLSLTEYLKINPLFRGKNLTEFDCFPVLVKLIDAQERLSVQVHPDDAYAMTREGEYGKTEMWYVLQAQPDAKLVLGFKKALSKQSLRRHIEEGTLLSVLNIVPARPGDVFFIDAGTVHAIGSGLLVAEIQQSSNSTYRIYDYNRVDKNGHRRELHIDKALDVINLSANVPTQKPVFTPYGGYHQALLGQCEYFTVSCIELQTRFEGAASELSFQFLLCLEGNVTLRWADGSLYLPKGQSAFIPAGTEKYTLLGKGRILQVSV